MGTIQGLVFKKQERGRRHFMNVISLAASAAPRSFVSRDWYVTARNFIQGVRSSQVAAEVMLETRDENEILKDRKAECDAIDKAANKSAAELLKHIWKHHRASVEGVPVEDLPTTAVLGEYITGTTRSAMLLYHPDRVTARHTPETKAMTSFICKRLSAAYAVVGAC